MIADRLPPREKKPLISAFLDPGATGKSFTARDLAGRRVRLKGTSRDMEITITLVPAGKKTESGL